MVNKFVYYNDTPRIVSIHPATTTHGCEVNMDAIKPGEVRTFILPENTYAWVKMWDYAPKGNLQILVSPHSEADDNYISHEPLNPLETFKAENIIERFKKLNPHNKEDK